MVEKTKQRPPTTAPATPDVHIGVMATKGTNRRCGRGEPDTPQLGQTLAESVGDVSGDIEMGPGVSVEGEGMVAVRPDGGHHGQHRRGQED